MFLFKSSVYSMFSKLRNKQSPYLNLQFTSLVGVTSHTWKPQLCSSHLSVHFGIPRERIIIYSLINCLCPWIVWSFSVQLYFVLFQFVIPEEVRLFRSHFDYLFYHQETARQEKSFSSTFGFSLVSIERHMSKEKRHFALFACIF